MGNVKVTDKFSKITVLLNQRFLTLEQYCIDFLSEFQVRLLTTVVGDKGSDRGSGNTINQCCGSGSGIIVPDRIQQKVREHINKTVV